MKDFHSLTPAAVLFPLEQSLILLNKSHSQALYSIIDKIYEMGGFQNKSELNSISLSMNKTTPFFNHKNIQMDQNKCRSKRDALKKIKMRGCVAVCFSSFSIIYDRLNAYAKQVKVNEFLKEEKIESMFDEED